MSQNFFFLLLLCITLVVVYCDFMLFISSYVTSVDQYHFFVFFFKYVFTLFCPFVCFFITVVHRFTYDDSDNRRYRCHCVVPWHTLAKLSSRNTLCYFSSLRLVFVFLLSIWSLWLQYNSVHTQSSLVNSNTIPQ